MVKRFFLGYILMLLSHSMVVGQQKWSLQRCVEYARQNSLTIQQNLLSIQESDVTVTRAKHNVYPNFSANTNGRINFGRTIDPTTNDFENSSIGQNTWGINGGMTLFNGGAIKNNILQSQTLLEAAKLDAQQFSEDLSLTVVQNYLAILFAQERLENARLTLTTTTEQLNQIDKLINAGARPEGDRLDIVAQQARDEQSIITFQNTVNLSKLQLKQLLRLPINETFDIEVPPVNALQPSIIQENLAGIYNHAISNRADIKSGELRIRSAELGVKLAKSQYLPTVTLGGSIGSLYSTLGRRIAGYKEIQSPLKVELNGQTATLNIFNEVPFTEKTDYFYQFKQNLGYGVGVGVNVPIYGNYAARRNVKFAEIGVQRSKLTNEQTKETIKNNIQTALNELAATRNSLEAATRTKVALQRAYDNMKARYDLGSANSFELVTSKNNLDKAIVEEIIARYDYIFRSKVIDYYMGRTIQIN